MVLLLDEICKDLQNFSQKDIDLLYEYYNVDSLEQLSTKIIERKATMSGTWETIPYIDDKFTDMTILGQGSYGTVYKAKSKQDDKFYAVKELDRIGDETKGEVFILSQLNHPNIVKYIKGYKLLYPAGQYLIQMEYIPGKPLNEANISNEQLQSINITLLKALAYMHSNNIIHRDIKPENIMIRDDNSPVLIDFGLSCKIASPQYNCEKPYVGTPLFFSRDILTSITTGRKLLPRENKYRDVWALGFTLVNKLAPQIIKEYEKLAIASANLRKLKNPTINFMQETMKQLMKLQPMIVNKIIPNTIKDKELLEMIQKMLVFINEPSAIKLVTEFSKKVGTGGAVGGATVGGAIGATVGGAVGATGGA